MPSSEYAERLAARRAWVSRQHRLHIRAGNARLLVALAAAWLAWAAFFKDSLSGWWLAAPLAAFLALLLFHDRILRDRELAERAVRYYERGLARIEDRWAGTGEPGDRFHDPAHPYAEDLDLFGKGGLFELLSTARTRAGEDTLARWLLQSAPPEIVLERQAAVAELRSKLDLREDLALLGEDVRASGDPKALIAWAESPPVLAPGAARVAATVLSLAMLICGSYWAWEPSILARIALSERANDKVRNLSGGQMRRVEIARALLHRPRLLVLDEPTVGLDIKSRADILAHVRKLVAEEGVAVLWATHLIDEVADDDDVIVLHRGRVLADGLAPAVAAAAGASSIRTAFDALVKRGEPQR